jgi:hypothetical protein
MSETDIQRQLAEEKAQEQAQEAYEAALGKRIQDLLDDPETLEDIFTESRFEIDFDSLGWLIARKDYVMIGLSLVNLWKAEAERMVKEKYYD